MGFRKNTYEGEPLHCEECGKIHSSTSDDVVVRDHTGRLYENRKYDDGKEARALPVDETLRMYKRAGTWTIDELQKKKPEVVKVYYPPFPLWKKLLLETKKELGYTDEDFKQPDNVTPEWFDTEEGKQNNVNVRELTRRVWKKICRNDGYGNEEIVGGEYMFVSINPNGIKSDEGTFIGFLLSDPITASLRCGFKQGDPIQLEAYRILEAYKDNEVIA